MLEEKYDLPDGWQWLPLGHVAKYINGRAFKPTDWESTGLPIIRIANLTNSNAKFHYYSKPVEDRYEVENGDLLISWSATLDAFIWDRGPAVLNQHIFRVEEDKKRIDKRYLYHAVRARLASLKAQVHGSGMQHITRGPFEATEIPIAPLSEQHRITQKIDDLFDQSRSALEALERVPALLKRFRQAVLAAAFRGELTERDENDESAAAILRARDQRPYLAKHAKPEPLDSTNLPELPRNWCWTSVGEIIDLLQYGTSVKADADSGSGVAVLRMGNIQEGRLDFGNLKYIDPVKDDIPKYRLEKDDILINRTNSPELVGKAAIFESPPMACVFASYLIRLRANSETILPRYLTFVINSVVGRRHIVKVKHQVAGQANINSQDIRQMPIPLAPLKEQQRVVVRIQGLFEQAENIERAVEVARRRAETVDQAILARAFRGEL